MASFQDILAKTGTSAPPPALPVGTYLAIVDGMPEITKKGRNQTDCIIFKLKLMQAQTDVDMGLLQKALNGAALSERSLSYTMWVTEASAWRLDQFFYHLGLVEMNASNEYVLVKSRGEYVNDCMGRQVLVSLGHRASDDGAQVFSEIKSTAKV